MPIKVIHIYPQNNPTIANYVSIVTEALKAGFEIQLTDEVSNFRALCKAMHPDIVHMHGNVTCSIPSYARLVLMPHGKNVVRKSYVTIARSEIEKDALSSQYTRLEIVRNPLVTKTATFPQAINQLSEIYHKVMDSDVLPLLDESTLQMFRFLLKAGITEDKRWVTAELPEADWHKLYIYAECEDVLDIVNKGIEVLGIEAPTKETTVNYLPEGFQHVQPLERNDVIGVLNDIAAGHVYLRRLVELDMLLRKNSIDETKLLVEIKDNQLDKIFPSVLQLLKEQTFFDEGYMPCLPIDNQTTIKLRKLLIDHLKV